MSKSFPLYAHHFLLIRYLILCSDFLGIKAEKLFPKCPETLTETVYSERNLKEGEKFLKKGENFGNKGKEKPEKGKIF